MFKIPSIMQAEEYLMQAESLNPGSWINHSRYVARLAERIAENCSGMDSKTAYVLGLIHDIGRIHGKMQAKHAIEGYKFMMGQGYEDAARICMTHTFQYKDVEGIYDNWDCSDEEKDFISKYLSSVEYNDYDLLIQLCDALTRDKGYCLLEEKMVSAVLNFGFKETTILKWKSIFKIKDRFEGKMGMSIYEILNNT